MKLAILNSLVITNQGVYKAEKITLMEARKMMFAHETNYESYAGHASSSFFLEELLGFPVSVNRIRFRQEKYQQALCFKLYDRYMEYKKLTEKELQSVNYDFFLLTRMD
ncbi:STIV orfB116 family protein [Shouchella patagoniensis]|uniref:STIV orfB116 family protein n=1 Tax=Shouchella patagoniensis TaxID=228576 RepID=UPI000994BA2E|nr:DUF1874 domain-containing protein [Shouchella patagoniensis]